MASIKIVNDQLENRGDAQNFLREIISQLDLGYENGVGWDFIPDEVTEVEKELPDQDDILDNHGVQLQVGDPVFAEQGYENMAGEMVDVYATIEAIDEEGSITLKSEEYDLSQYTYEASELVKKEAEAPVQKAPEEKSGIRLPWNRDDKPKTDA